MNKINLLLFFLLTPIAVYSQNNRIYVNIAATGTSTGQSWADAYSDLQSALSVALAGDTVWIAEGSYYPTVSNNRSISFEPKSGVRIFGGFAGSESTLGQRDWSAHPVILSGDIGIPGDSSDNSYNVLYLFRPDSNTILDGLILRDGVANNIAGASSTRSRLVCGGGLYIMAEGAEAYPEIRNCRFEHNTAQYSGAGAMVNGTNDGSAGPRWHNCIFEDNQAHTTGGGLAKYGASLIDRGVDLYQCSFIRNRSNSRGGGLFYTDSDGNDLIEIQNCRFEENIAKISGGGAFFFLGRMGKIVLHFHKSEFYGNISSSGAALSFSGNSSDFDGTIEIDSCIYRLNKTEQLNPNNSYFDIIHCDLVSTSQSKFKLSNALFEQNNALHGADYILSIAFYGSLAIIENTVFKNNETDRIIGFFGFSESIIEKSIFSENKQESISLHGEVGKVHYRNCSFTTNSGINPLYFEFNSPMDTCIFENCTIYNDALNSRLVGGSLDNLYIRNTFIKKTPATYFDIPNCKTYLANCYLPNFDCEVQSPDVICEGGIITSGDPMFIDMAHGDFRLQPCSPLINAGNNAYVTGSTDLAGQVRIQSSSVDIGAYEAPSLALSIPPQVTPACAQTSSGTITISPINGCEPYTYEWEPSLGNGPIINGLPPSNYLYTITDANGMKIQDTVSVPSSPNPELAPITQDIQCGFVIGGSAAVTVSSGTAPYNFAWSNNSTDSLISMLPAGNYVVTVTDGNGCRDSSHMIISQTGQLTLMVDGIPIACFGDMNGELSATPVTGKAPFSYQWSQGSVDSLLTGLGPGDYAVTVTDVYSCSSTFNFHLEEPLPLQTSASAAPSNNLQSPNGMATVNAQGGMPTYTYAWSNDSTGQMITGLAPGAYTVTATDANGCTSTTTAVVEFVSGTVEAEAFHVQVWPNPMEEKLEVLISGVADHQKLLLSLQDALGRQVAIAHLTNGHAVLGVRMLPKGNYVWVLWRNGQAVQSGNVVK